jgi:hypothetical protein
METKWKKIKNYSKYKISNKGEIINTKTGRYMKQTLSGRNLSYLTVNLYGDNKKPARFYVHRLLAENYLKKVVGKNHVNHKDGNKMNNVITNLEWCTPYENNKHAQEKGLSNTKEVGENHPRAILNNRSVRHIKMSLLCGISPIELAKIFSVTRQTIYDIKSGRKWGHVSFVEI